MVWENAPMYLFVTSRAEDLNFMDFQKFHGNVVSLADKDAYSSTRHATIIIPSSSKAHQVCCLLQQREVL
jgi:hypothetical protein